MSITMETTAFDAASSDRGSKNLSNDTRLAIFQYHLGKSNEGKLGQGSIPEAAARFGVNNKTVSRIWHRGLDTGSEEGGLGNVSSRMAGNVGRKKLDFDQNSVAAIPLRQRINQCYLVYISLWYLVRLSLAVDQVSMCKTLPRITE